MNTKPPGYSIQPLPPERQLIMDGGRISARKHTAIALIEVDVSKARQFLREYKVRTGESLSFTAFVIACLGQAVSENKAVHAYRDWRNRLILFDEVDVNMSVEIEKDGRKVVLPHFVRAANKRTVYNIHSEIRAVQARPQKTKEFGLIWLVRLPRFIRDIFYGFVFKHPHWLKASFCTVGLTAVGMFGKRGGWAIPFNVHTLDVALGGISEKPMVLEKQIEIREVLCLTLLFDQEIMDGTTAVRFTSRLKELVESGYGLCDKDIHHEYHKT